MLKKATDTFRTPPYRHNCAQAIAYRWRELYGKTNIVESYSPYVGGHAPQGYCGALYAAMQACPKEAETIKRDFASKCGGVMCHDIRLGNRVPCVECVDVADKLVERYSERRNKERI